MLKRNTLADAVWVLPVSALLLILFHSSIWFPGITLPWTPIVILGFVLIWYSADRSPWAGVAVALTLIVFCALLARPDIHLWGDGTLRLRNLEAGISITGSARFQPGDTLLHGIAIAAGLSPEGSFALVGAAAGVIYLAGVLLAARSSTGDRHTRGALITLLLVPAWVIFFTGYVESYSVLAAMLVLSAGLVLARRSPVGVSLCALLGASAHLLGVLLVPGALLYSRERRSRAGILVGLAAVPAVAVWILLTGGAGGEPPLQALLQPGPAARLGLIVFAAPALVLMPLTVSRKPAASALVNSAVWLLVFLLFPLERGAARDWDLGAVMLVPVYFTLAAASVHRRKLLLALTAASVLLAGPRLASFLDPEVSLSRYELSIELSSDPDALEELAISRRDDGRPGEAAEMFHRAYELSGNGRHLSQEAEALRLAGRPDEAVPSAILATELRPDVETTWLQLALVARDADDAELAMLAAERHGELYPESPGLWNLALEAAVPEGDARTAWICAQRALACEDTLVTVMINAGTAAWMNGFTGLAMERFLLASDMAPGSPLPWYNMGMVMLETGDTALAGYYMARALEADSSFMPAAEVLDLLE